MRGGAAAAEEEPGDTQPRVWTLQQMLRTASRGSASSSSSSHQYTPIVSDSSGRSGIEPPQDGEFASGETDGDRQQRSGQNGVRVDSATSNPFYAYFLESGDARRAEDVGTEAAGGGDGDGVLVPRRFVEPRDELFPSFTPPSHVESPPLAPAAAARRPTETFSSWDFFSGSAHPDPPTVGGEEVKLWEEPSFPTEEAGWFPAERHGPFNTSREHLESSPSRDTLDPFSSPVARNLFQDVSGRDDPFSPTPSKPHVPFRDVSNGTRDIFRPSNTAETGTGFSRPSLHSVSETKLDTPSSPDVFRAPPSESLASVQPNSSSPSRDVVLTTPQGTKHSILHPTPFSQARGLTAGPSPGDWTHVHTFRRPPKPLPRSRPPRRQGPDVSPAPLKPVEPEPGGPEPPSPSLKPVPRPPPPAVPPKPKTPEPPPGKPVNFQVLEDVLLMEDVLLIGQEMCVEDWPEDSPELDPEFKPSGKLRLRRESLRVKTDSDGGSGEDQDGNPSKKKDRKFRMSLLSRRGSKDKFPDDTRDGKSRALPRRSSKVSASMSRERPSEPRTAAAEDEDELDELDGLDYRKPLKTKVKRLLRRASTMSTVPEQRREYSPREAKTDGEELRGAAGYTPRKGFKEDAFEDPEEIKGFGLHSTGKGTVMADVQDEDFYGYEDLKPKKPAKVKLPLKGRRSSKEDTLEDSERRRRDREGEELWGREHAKQKSKAKGLNAFERKAKTSHGEGSGRSHLAPQPLSRDVSAEDKFTGSRADVFDSEQYLEDVSKPKKSLKVKGFKKNKAKSKAWRPEWDEPPPPPPGATPTDFPSEAAKEAWLSAQQDERVMTGFEDEDEDGDTDSLMEWWNTVEQWDELPSDDEDRVQQDDQSKSFGVLADKVHRGLRVFNKVFTERAEVLWQAIILLHAITDDINAFHQKAKVAGITTTAVGSVTAIAGLALVPVTFGASLVLTAVGVGMATAGGIASASDVITDTNNMHDRKKVEAALKEYEGHLLDLAKILHFIDQGLYRLRGHAFLRSGTQHYAEDWDTRRTVQIISLVDSPVMRATEITDGAVAAVQGLFRGMDRYFVKDSRELKRGCRREVVAQIKEVANGLNATLVELNVIREELQDATGDM